MNLKDEAAGAAPGGLAPPSTVTGVNSTPPEAVRVILICCEGDAFSAAFSPEGGGGPAYDGM